MDAFWDETLKYLPHFIGGVVLAVLAYYLAKKRSKTKKDLTHEAAEEIILELLNDEWPMRKFTTIKSRLGGLEEDEIRQALLRVGAVKFKGQKGEELWGLKEKNQGKVSPGIQKWG